jgi:peptidoglycan hydrolase-like protein with peptidoglycan-binding domain
MTMWSRLTSVVAVAALALLALAPVALARGSNANVAALQVALRALHRYGGGIDGIPGPRTKSAIRSFQRAHRLAADGVAGPRTRSALGRRGRPGLGSRVMTYGDRGWDVAALQFMLSRRGYSTGGVDGGFGAGTLSAVRRFQSAAGITVDGRVGSGTLRALRHHRSSSGVSSSTPTGPIRLLRPVAGAIGDGFGYPGGRRHDGVDFPEPYGTAVGAAGRGTVAFAGWNAGGYGNLIVVQHRLGYQTWYAHLSAFDVHQGSAVAGGTVIGRVGSTGRSTGPHLHFELRHDGIPINPVPYLLSSTSLGKRIFKAEAPTRCMDREDPSTPAGGAIPPRRQNPRTAVLAPC